MQDYARELCRRLAAFSPLANAYEIDTVYFGGGTPTLLPARSMALLTDAIQKHFHVAHRAEITCECNPATADAEKLRSFRSLGINRLSIGLQSAHDHELALLGRAHSFSDFCRTYSDARRAGFENISVDLMYGIPDQTLESFDASLAAVLALCPEHLSSYGLKIEEGTRFASLRDSLRLPDEDTEFAMYKALSDRASDGGIRQYEISNFARPGMESRHNLRYWRGEEYVGFGPAAYSYFGGERFGNSRDLAAFLRGEDITAEREHLTDCDEKEEYVMLRLRLCEGLSLSEYRNRFGSDFLLEHPTVRRYLAAGFLSLTEDRLAFTTQGFFVSNSILSELI